MVDEPVRGFEAATDVMIGKEELKDEADEAGKDNKDAVDKANFDKGGQEKTALKDDKDESDKVDFDKGGPEKTKEVSDKEKETSDKDEAKDSLDKSDKEKEVSDKEKEVSDKDKELEKELAEKGEGESETLSIEEWASRHPSESVRLLNPGPRDVLL